jgi:hypothetical protein
MHKSCAIRPFTILKKQQISWIFWQNVDILGIANRDKDHPFRVRLDGRARA